ncbi:MAG TPA: glycosyltransferase [Candidatus Paceibacterota bacterium]
MPEPHLSIVIPAYNEEARLPPTLQKLFAYLPPLGRPFEILISDDGSRDGTVAVVKGLQADHPELVLLSDGVNRGRTTAMRRGFEAARGEFILETDADGSVADEAIGRFMHKLESDPGLAAVFGSREMPGAHKALHQPPLRVFLGYGFIYLTRLVFWMWSSTDFALGFKMFRRAAARDIFAHQYEPHVVAEAELVFVAQYRKHKFVELPVTWTDNADSRIRPVREVFRSLVGLCRIRVRSLMGRYN